MKHVKQTNFIIIVIEERKSNHQSDAHFIPIKILDHHEKRYCRKVKVLLCWPIKIWFSMTALLVKLVKLRQTIGFSFLFVRLLNVNEGFACILLLRNDKCDRSSLKLYEVYHLRSLKSIVSSMVTIS